MPTCEEFCAEREFRQREFGFPFARGRGLGCAHPSIRGLGKWTPKQYVALFGSPPCRYFAQASTGLWITLFLPRSLPRSLSSPFSAAQSPGPGADVGKAHPQARQVLTIAPALPLASALARLNWSALPQPPRDAICVPCASPDLFEAVPPAAQCAGKPYLLARSEGFEPPTPRFEVWCSIQLSYERRGLFIGASL